jgi:hypothetical protein
MKKETLAALLAIAIAFPAQAQVENIKDKSELAELLRRGGARAFVGATSELDRPRLYGRGQRRGRDQLGELT